MFDTPTNFEKLGQSLVIWYQHAHRKLPWRETKDPYKILVSETMLQQTRVDTVIPYYHAFLRQFPTLRALADAPEDAVLKAWQGLGYYRRAKNLQKAAKMCVEAHGGQIPNDVPSVRKLAGVGPYTTGAVMSIAFDEPVAAVDGNVLRVMARLFGISDAIDTPAVRNQITDYMQRTIEHTVPSLFTQAVMELGAIVCTPRNAQCLICPVSEMCTAKHEGLVDTLPNKKQAKQRKQIDMLAFWIEVDGALMVQKRAETGLLANMWQLPALECEGYGQLSDAYRDRAAERGLHRLLADRESDVSDHGKHQMVREALPALEPSTQSVASLRHFVEIATERHLFTHLEWNVHVLRPVGMNPRQWSDRPDLPFVRIHQLSELVWPKVYEKLIMRLLQVDVRKG